jgi:hypothetical protein
MFYKFKQVDNISGRCAETTVEFNADSLQDILEHFEMFLRGSGFNPSGTLDFVSNEEYYGEIPDFDPPTDQQHCFTEVDDKLCQRCGLTKGQLGTNICYDMKCGFNDN